MAKKKQVHHLNTIYAFSLGAVGVVVFLYFIFTLSARLALSEPISPLTPDSAPYAYEIEDVESE
jgi:hypothetical protein